MSTVRGHSSIYTKRTARKQYPCDGPHDTYFAPDVIREDFRVIPL